MLLTIVGWGAVFASARRRLGPAVQLPQSRRGLHRAPGPSHRPRASEPAFFYYPSFFLYLLAALYRVIGPVLASRRRVDLLDTSTLPVDPGPYYLAGRLLVVAMGGGVGVPGLPAGRGRPSEPQRWPWSQPYFWPSNRFHVRYSHVAVTDVPATAFALLAMLLLLAGGARGGGQRWLLAGAIAAGLATSIKYNLGMLVIPATVAGRDGSRRPSRRSRRGEDCARHVALARARAGLSAGVASMCRCCWHSSSRRRSRFSTPGASCTTSRARTRSWRTAGWGTSTSATATGTTSASISPARSDSCWWPSSSAAGLRLVAPHAGRSHHRSVRGAVLLLHQLMARAARSLPAADRAPAAGAWRRASAWP